MAPSGTARVQPRDAVHPVPAAGRLAGQRRAAAVARAVRHARRSRASLDSLGDWRAMTPDRYEREFHLPAGHATSFAGGPLAALRNQQPRADPLRHAGERAVPDRRGDVPRAPASGVPAAATRPWPCCAAHGKRRRRCGHPWSTTSCCDMRCCRGTCTTEVAHEHRWPFSCSLMLGRSSATRQSTHDPRSVKGANTHDSPQARRRPDHHGQFDPSSALEEDRWRLHTLGGHRGSDVAVLGQPARPTMATSPCGGLGCRCRSRLLDVSARSTPCQPALHLSAVLRQGSFGHLLLGAVRRRLHLRATRGSPPAT